MKSRVAMDFTGTGGRVVDDPNEAIGVAIEEGHQWRVRTCTSTLTRFYYIYVVIYRWKGTQICGRLCCEQMF